MEEVTENFPWKRVVNFLKEVLTGGAVIEQFSGCQPVTGKAEVLIDPKITFYLKFTSFFYKFYTIDIARPCLRYNSPRI